MHLHLPFRKCALPGLHMNALREMPEITSHAFCQRASTYPLDISPGAPFRFPFSSNPFCSLSGLGEQKQLGCRWAEVWIISSKSVGEHSPQRLSEASSLWSLERTQDSKRQARTGKQAVETHCVHLRFLIYKGEILKSALPRNRYHLLSTGTVLNKHIYIRDPYR